MQDTLYCPICGDRLKNCIYKNTFLSYIDKKSTFINRVCPGTNHLLTLTIDKKSKNVDYLSLSLKPDFSVRININFLEENCTALFIKNNAIVNSIYIPKKIDLDFPDLKAFKDKIFNYIAFL
jgi:hypothetical protein